MKTLIKVLATQVEDRLCITRHPLMDGVSPTTRVAGYPQPATAFTDRQ